MPKGKRLLHMNVTDEAYNLFAKKYVEELIKQKEGRLYRGDYLTKIILTYFKNK